MLTRWTDCLGQTSSGTCPGTGKIQWAGFYQAIFQTFVANYGSYLNFVPSDACTPPSPNYLAPEPGSSPPVRANKYALLRYIYGWVCFNNGYNATATAAPCGPAPTATP